jgi:hypothetical protein
MRCSGIRCGRTCSPMRSMKRSPFPHENDMLAVTSKPSAA